MVGNGTTSTASVIASTVDVVAIVLPLVSVGVILLVGILLLVCYKRARQRSMSSYFQRHYFSVDNISYSIFGRKNRTTSAPNWGHVNEAFQTGECTIPPRSAGPRLDCTINKKKRGGVAVACARNLQANDSGDDRKKSLNSMQLQKKTGNALETKLDIDDEVFNDNKKTRHIFDNDGELPKAQMNHRRIRASNDEISQPDDECLDGPVTGAVDSIHACKTPSLDGIPDAQGDNEGGNALEHHLPEEETNHDFAAQNYTNGEYFTFGPRANDPESSSITSVSSTDNESDSSSSESGKRQRILNDALRHLASDEISSCSANSSEPVTPSRILVKNRIKEYEEAIYAQANKPKKSQEEIIPPIKSPEKQAAQLYSMAEEEYETIDEKYTMAGIPIIGEEQPAARNAPLINDDYAFAEDCVAQTKIGDENKDEEPTTNSKQHIYTTVKRLAKRRKKI